MRKSLFIIAFLLVYPLSQAFAIKLPTVIENTVYSDHIRTVEMYRAGWKLSNPIITLNSDEELIFSFDDLNDEVKQYQYTIYHCDRNWKISKIPQQEYLSSFTDFPVTDYEYSRNTNIRYVNYRIGLPNNDIPLVLSGNYALVVFDRQFPEEPLLIWRFYVVEQLVSINARIRRATHDTVNGEHQEVDFVVQHGNYQIQNPHTDIKVVINQNNRTDNAITNLKPMYVGNGVLEYDYNLENNFKGENEFRAFEMRDFRIAGEGVESISLHPPFYHATLLPHYPRLQQSYSFYKEMNGNFHIEALNKRDPDIESDYVFVHFNLQVLRPLLGGSIYVFGKLSNWQCSKQYEMNYSMERQQYELTLLLKQGYYNFIYAYKDHQTGEIRPYHLEGSHHETENDYYIYVYHGRINDRYDRLIGYQRFNSLTNR